MGDVTHTLPPEMAPITPEIAMNALMPLLAFTEQKVK